MTEALENLGPVVSGPDARLPWRPREFFFHYVEAIARARRLNYQTVSSTQLRVSGECYSLTIMLDGSDNSTFVKDVQLLFGEQRVESTMVRFECHIEVHYPGCEKVETRVKG